MKKELLEQMKPILETFADSLMKLEERIALRQKVLEKEIQNTFEEQRKVKDQGIENNKRVKIVQDKLTEKIAEQQRISIQIKDEFSKYNKLNRSLEQKESKIKAELKSAETEREFTIKELTRQKRKTEEYQLKTDSLKKDFSILDNRTRDLNDREKKIRIKEKVLLVQEGNLVEKERILGERELDVRIKEKSIVLEYKRLKLNGT